MISKAMNRFLERVTLVYGDECRSHLVALLEHAGNKPELEVLLQKAIERTCDDDVPSVIRQPSAASKRTAMALAH